mgnify:CR=1 FL=1
MNKINIKPISVNEAFKGRRFKTEKYNSFEQEFILKLPNLSIGIPPYKLILEMGLSSKGSDLDNTIKQTQDCLSKKYGFNDNQIYEIQAVKFIVQKGDEYIKFDIIEL